MKYIFFQIFLFRILIFTKALILNVSFKSTYYSILTKDLIICNTSIFLIILFIDSSNLCTAFSSKRQYLRMFSFVQNIDLVTR